MNDEKIKTKRGYLSNFNNYYDWFVSHTIKWQKEHMFKCEHCGKNFIPNAPNQKYCGPENGSCYKNRTDPSLSNGMWYKKATSVYLTPYKYK